MGQFIKRLVASCSQEAGETGREEDEKRRRRRRWASCTAQPYGQFNYRKAEILGGGAEWNARVLGQAGPAHTLKQPAHQTTHQHRTGKQSKNTWKHNALPEN